MGNRGLKRYFFIFLILLVISALKAPSEASPADGYIYLGKIQINHISTTFPDRIALDSRGNLYVVDGYNDHVMKYDREGNYTGDIKVENASAVAVAPDGRVYIGANGTSPLVGIYEGNTLKGYLGKGPGEFESVRDIAIDEDTGNVYVVDSKRNLVGIYTASGEHLRDIGGLSYPHAVDIEASEVYIVDAPVVRIPLEGATPPVRG
jgi:DNA-binding beta-propeller fold protein YncE